MSDGPAKTVVALADLEEVAVTWSRYAPGTRGPGPHVHRRHADAFYVLEGSLLFGVGPDAAEQIEASAGSLVLAPAGLVHTFRNEGHVEARFLNIHAPGEGFIGHLRASRDGRHDDAKRFDSEDPPPDGGRPAADAVVRLAGEGETLMMGATSVRFKAEGRDGDGTFSLTEQTLAPPFQGPLPHRHDSLVDSFYVLDGTLALQLDDAILDAEPGTFALAPPQTPHTFANPGPEPVRALNLMSPGGFEQYLKDAAAEAASGPPDPERLAAIASRYDFRPAVQAY